MRITRLNCAKCGGAGQVRGRCAHLDEANYAGVAGKVAGAERLVGPARRIRAGFGHGTLFYDHAWGAKTGFTRYAADYIPGSDLCKRFALAPCGKNKGAERHGG